MTGHAERGRGRGASPERRPSPAARAGEPGPAPRTCDLCGAPVLERHCKILCLNCGYQRDCSDP